MSTGLEFLPDFDSSVLDQGVYVGPNRRSPHRLDRLSRRLDRVCSTAVDALQIAAILESDGFNDRIARDEYGFSDVFELAEELYRRVPARPLPTLVTPREGDLWRTGRELSKGLLFTLPGLFYPAAFAVCGVRAATLGLTLAAVAGWAWSQAMAHLTYRLLGRGDPKGAARLLLALALFGVVGVTGAMMLASQIKGDLGGAVTLAAVTLAAAQMVYQVSASILFMYERELWLFAALVPGVAVSLVFIGLGANAVSPRFALAAAAGSIALTLMAAVGCAVKAAIGKREHPVALTLGDVWAALPFVVYGAACAVFVAFDTLRFWVLNPEAAPPALGFAIVPLVLSMGALEWQLRRFRERGIDLLCRSRRREDFSRQVRLEFFGALGRYTLLLAVLSVLAWLLTAKLGLERLQTLTLLAANVALGAGFFAAFVLIGQHRIGAAIGALGVAALVRASELIGPFVALQPRGFDVYYLLSCAFFTVLVLTAVQSSLTTVIHYR
jgi:hypothetical protein